MVVYGNGRQTCTFHNETTGKEFLHALTEEFIAASDPLPCNIYIAYVTLDMVHTPA